VRSWVGDLGNLPIWARQLPFSGMDSYTVNELHARLEEALHQREVGLVEADPDLYFKSSRLVVQLQKRIAEGLMAGSGPTREPAHAGSVAMTALRRTARAPEVHSLST
jgi:hypothetical protein